MFENHISAKKDGTMGQTGWITVNVPTHKPLAILDP